jgi:hypothetical protein
MSELSPTSSLPALGTAHSWDACDQCQAPLEARQRYCVVCGTRRRSGDDPATRYFAEATRRARAVRVAVGPPARRGLSPMALLLALVPLAAALGVLVGRGQDAGDERLVEILRSQRPPVVNITGATAGAATPATTAAAAAATATAKAGKDAKAKTGTGKRTSDGAEVLATGPAGDARKLEDAKVTEKQLDESKAAVKRINESKGKDYVESQRNLPDQIVIP